MAEIDGATLMAQSLKAQGVEHMFGIVGFPVHPIANACQREGIKFYGMRNEQSASYAAQAAGYLLGRPQACLVVSGPGVVHALAGLANAWSNGWPMLLIGGASDSFQDGMGAFQEAPQVEAARLWSKHSMRVETVGRIPFHVETAVRKALYGRPGAAYIDMPNDIIVGKVEEEAISPIRRVPDPPRTQAPEGTVQEALALLKTAERPLVVVGKGMAWSRAEAEVQEFIEKTQLPFLPSPMGKGVIPDDHPLSVAPGRTYALQNTDVVFLMGARLNWIMHFGLPPRWAPDVKVIQLDIDGNEIGTNVPASVGLLGDGKAIVRQLNQALEQSPWQFSAENRWRSGLQNAVATNTNNTEPMLVSDDVPMGYYRVLREIRDALPHDAMLVSEGASTMDISRQVIPNYLPRTRLDAGSFGTMGIGCGFAVAAAACHPERRIVDLEGDSAFGFSGMEVETACRYNLPITYIVVNNNGVGGGPSTTDHNPLTARAGAYTANARYEKIAEAFGGLGFFVERPDEIRPAIDKAFASGKTAVINIMIDTRAQRRPQQFQWHTR
ncbi:MAG TPA: thiamine pyrophosphate-binding protein [Dehalococcoidia bacterium]|nr:thiamine pyrophosphate-binding protein [Dehalococcoidia bacterium]